MIFSLECAPLPAWTTHELNLFWILWFTILWLSLSKNNNISLLEQYSKHVWYLNAIACFLCQPSVYCTRRSTNIQVCLFSCFIHQSCAAKTGSQTAQGCFLVLLSPSMLCVAVICRQQPAVGLNGKKEVPCRNNCGLKSVL